MMSCARVFRQFRRSWLPGPHYAQPVHMTMRGFSQGRSGAALDRESIVRCLQNGAIVNYVSYRLPCMSDTALV